MPAIISPTSRLTHELFGITHKTNFCKYIEIDITQNIWIHTHDVINLQQFSFLWHLVIRPVNKEP